MVCVQAALAAGAVSTLSRVMGCYCSRSWAAIVHPCGYGWGRSRCRYFLHRRAECLPGAHMRAHVQSVMFPAHVQSVMCALRTDS